MTLNVKATYMRHDGGTKFYEAVLISTDGGAKAMLIKRWGKVETRRKGGETMITQGNFGAMQLQYATIIKSKKTRGYSPTDNAPMHGMLLAQKSGPISLHSNLLEYCGQQYPAGTVETITKYFEIDVAEQEHKPPAPNTNPSAYAEWGSF